jgi:hypothetical protein
MVAAVGPQGLISPLPYIVDSIMFSDSTPLPCQRQRPAGPRRRRRPFPGVSSLSGKQREEAI